MCGACVHMSSQVYNGQSMLEILVSTCPEYLSGACKMFQSYECLTVIKCFQKIHKFR